MPVRQEFDPFSAWSSRSDCDPRNNSLIHSYVYDVVTCRSIRKWDSHRCSLSLPGLVRGPNRQLVSPGGRGIPVQPPKDPGVIGEWVIEACRLPTASPVGAHLNLRNPPVTGEGHSHHGYWVPRDLGNR